MCVCVCVCVSVCACARAQLILKRGPIVFSQMKLTFSMGWGGNGEGPNASLVIFRGGGGSGHLPPLPPGSAQLLEQCL